MPMASRQPPFSCAFCPQPDGTKSMTLLTAAAGIEDLDPETHKVVFLANVADPGPLAARLFIMAEALL